MSIPSLARRARGAIGLRGRIVAVVLITTVTTLAIAAVLVLGPLEKSLGHADQSALSKAVPRGTRHTFSQLPLGKVNSQPWAHASLVAAQHTLQKETGGAFVTVLGSPGVHGEHATQLVPDAGAADDTFDDVPWSFRTKRSQRHIVSIGGDQYASVVIPFKVREIVGPTSQKPAVKNVGGHTVAPTPRPKQPERRAFWYVLVVRKPISAIPVVRVVSRAMLEAAAAGLVLTLLLGIGLSGRLVARLRALRRTAIQVEAGDPGVVPEDRTRDEVGDLARSLAAMQERLRRQEEARRAFVATASHELRTPLTSLDGMLELLQDDLRYDDPDVADARELVARARAQSRRLARLAADLLDLSRMDAQVQLRSEPIELGEMSRAVLAEFELGAEERGIRVELELRGESVWALGDPGSVARILRILVDNAVRVSPRGSAVRVRLRRGRRVTLSVCDDGPGVPEEEREVIFQRFKRGRDTSGQAGFGLGLAIGRELARRMDGDLVLEAARAPGATFTLILPPAPPGDRDTDFEPAVTAPSR
ncbi:MAG TPA: HAMP domain-containing sensor histidine kinase [Solirubrobacteraceae bacterium]|jgi:signal transduction histidine kinase|nr:HAMP domain-containing sensor histidine kinase [Solirubrobacteraceae bacterium]